MMRRMQQQQQLAARGYAKMRRDAEAREAMRRSAGQAPGTPRYSSPPMYSYRPRRSGIWTLILVLVVLNLIVAALLVAVQLDLIAL
jgi:hypothetical protein